jgi:hypothetical protein
MEQDQAAGFVPNAPCGTSSHRRISTDSIKRPVMDRIRPGIAPSGTIPHREKSESDAPAFFASLLIDLTWDLSK